MKYRYSAFTLIELLVVIVIIGILSGISIAGYNDYIEKARLAKARYNSAQVQRLFLAEDASSEKGLFAGWYGFDGENAVNTSVSPYVLDKSKDKNHLTYISGGLMGGSIDVSQSSDTGSGIGTSLKINNSEIGMNDYLPNSPTEKLTMAFWVKTNKLGDLCGNSFDPFVLNHHTIGFRVYPEGSFHNPDGGIRFYIQREAVGVTSPAGIFKKNTWHYVVGTYDGVEIKLWIDGDLVAAQNTPNPVNLQIGTARGIFFSNHAFCGGEFDTFIDEPMVFPHSFAGERLN